MIMLILCYGIIFYMLWSVCIISIRYNFGYGFETAPLSPDFVQHFYHELNGCDIPVRALVSMKPLPMGTGYDTRSVMAVAGNLVVNEQACRALSAEAFAAGLALERTRIQSHYLWYDLLTAILMIGFIPFFYLIGVASKIFAAGMGSGLIASGIAALGDVALFLYQWPLLLLPVALGCGVYGVELPMARWLARETCKELKQCDSLLEYIRYQEAHVTPELNQVFAIAWQRAYLEHLQALDYKKESK